MNSKLPFYNLPFIKETETHYIYRDSIYCGDSQKHLNHGHLYISKKFPVFYCFKCNKSGNLLQLSKDLHESCHIQYTSTIEYNFNYLNIEDILLQTKSILEGFSIYITDQEKEYFRKRLGLKEIYLSSIIKYSLFPDYYARGFLYNNIFSKINNDCYRTWTLRGFGTGLGGRAHNSDSKLRYINGDINVPWKEYILTDSYFIRNSVIDKYNKNYIPNYLIICEGIYDCVSLYLNRSRFMIDEKDSLFVAVQCSSYDRALKVFYLLYNQLPKNIIIFADSNITPNFLKKQFINAKNNNCNITINWPMVKDWNPISSIQYSLNL